MGRGGGTVAGWDGELLLVVRPSGGRGLALPGGGLRWGEARRMGALRRPGEETPREIAPARFVPARLHRVATAPAG